MKKMLFLIIVIILSLNGYTQEELGTKTKAFPPVNKEKKAKKVIPPSKMSLPIETPNPFDPKRKSVNDFKIPKNDFILPGEVVYRRNQNLGVFKTNAQIANVKYRDAAFVDGDKIRVYLNDKVVKYQVDLDGNFQGFQIILVKGVNKIDFEALNEGLASPNTAEFKIFDEKGLVISSNQWNLGTGFKATIVLVKN
jgi:hypothetical protein